LEKQKEKGRVKEGNGGTDERAKESFHVKGMYGEIKLTCENESEKEL